MQKDHKQKQEEEEIIRGIREMDASSLQKVSAFIAGLEIGKAQEKKSNRKEDDG